ncbi:MAG: class I SAM-dependent methyltransferase [Pyrinomonadaceae bacterium]
MAVSERFQGANVVDAGRLSPYWGEHAARYNFAMPFVSNREVLDIACGTGYGIGLLRSMAKLVTGVDIDPAAAKQALVECGANASVLLGNGLGLPFEDESFDVITSFETLEHLYERGRFLAELRRVLRPGGVLLLSTPNANYTKPVNGTPSNRFHIHEYTPDELRSELGSHFTITNLLGQTLDGNIKIPPFYEAQLRLSNNPVTQLSLFGWKVFNKIPFNIRERLSEAIWNAPFYPTEMDYSFNEDTLDAAPVQVAVCRKSTE